MKFCKETLYLNVKDLSEEWTYMSPPGGSLVELAYEGVSSKFSCFLILSGPTRPCFSHIATLCQKEQYRHTLKIIGRYLLTPFGRRSKKRNNTK